MNLTKTMQFFINLEKNSRYSAVLDITYHLFMSFCVRKYCSQYYILDLNTQRVKGFADETSFFGYLGEHE